MTETGIVSALEADGKVKSVKTDFQRTFSGTVFPLVLTPAQSDSFTSFAHLQQWTLEHKADLKKAMMNNGAVLFRGFSVVSEPKHFNEMILSLGVEPLPYVGGAAPRKIIHENVFTSNEAPPDEKIPFHHEMAQVPKYPSTIYFYCLIAAKSGGATPILRSDELLRRAEEKYPEFVRELKEKLLIYTRVLPDHDDPLSPIGRSWRSTFLTDDRKVAEEKASDLNVTLEWLPDGNVASVSGKLAALKTYTNQLGESRDVFFNSMIAAYTGWRDSRNDPVKAVTFGDKTLLDSNIIEDLARIADEISVDMLWETSDVILIDNNLVMHARKSFEGPRRLLAFLGK